MRVCATPLALASLSPPARDCCPLLFLFLFHVTPILNYLSLLGVLLFPWGTLPSNAGEVFANSGGA